MTGTLGFAAACVVCFTFGFVVGGLFAVEMSHPPRPLPLPTQLTADPRPPCRHDDLPVHPSSNHRRPTLGAPP